MSIQRIVARTTETECALFSQIRSLPTLGAPGQIKTPLSSTSLHPQFSSTMKLNSTMRLTVICLAASTVSAAYNGFFGKPTSNVESNDKTRRIEQQLRQSFGGAAGNGNSRSIKNGNARSGPRGAPKSAPQEGDVGEQGRALYYGYYEPVPHYYYEPKMYGPYYDPYEYEDYYYYPKKYPEYHYPKYYKSMKSKSKKGKSMKWGGKMDMGKMSWKKWQSKWQKLRKLHQTDSVVQARFKISL